MTSPTQTDERPSSLSRVLEPEVMDSPQEALDYDAMDHAEVNRRFVVDFLAAAAGLLDRGAAEVLDLGTGTARIPIEICGQNSAARILGVDLAESMLNVARQNVARAGLSTRIALQQADGKRLGFAAGRFAAVISNTIVHHIPDPRPMLAEAVRVLAPGGLLFIRDLFRPAHDAAVRQLVATHAGQANAAGKRMLDESLRAALSLQEIRALVAELGISPQAVQPTSDRHWTLIARPGATP